MSTTPPAYAPGNRPMPTGERSLSGGEIAMIVIGSILALFGLLLVAGGAVAVAASQSRDSAGYLTSGPASVATESYAVSVPDIGIDARGPDEAYVGDLLGSVRIRVTGADPAEPVFVGIAPTRDVDAYLRGVGHADVRDIQLDPVRVEYTENDGGAPASVPAEQTFWERSDTGTGTRTLEWQVAAGDWTVLVMNADASPGVRAEVDLGGTLPVLRWVAIGLVVAGALVLIGGALLIVLPLVGRHRRPA